MNKPNVTSYVGTIIKERIDKDIHEHNTAQLKAAMEVLSCVEMPGQEKRWLITHVASHLKAQEKQKARANV